MNDRFAWAKATRLRQLVSFLLRVSFSSSIEERAGVKRQGRRRKGDESPELRKLQEVPDQLSGANRIGSLATLAGPAQQDGATGSLKQS
jgi:hypothetical protein